MTPVPDQGLPIAPTAMMVALDQLATCVCELLTLEGAGKPCWCGLVPGGANISWEACSGGECSPGVCGMGYVRLVAVFPYETFPVQTVVDRCNRPLAWAVEVGALRCLPVHEDGTAPTPAEMQEVALNQYLDATALVKAIQCCDLPNVALSGYQPLGPLGGCVGGSWAAFLSEF